MEKSVEEIISELITLCLIANTSGDECVFLNLSGHVKAIDIRLMKQNEVDKRNYNPYFDDDLYYEGKLFDRKEFNSKIKKWMLKLQDIIKKKG